MKTTTSNLEKQVSLKQQNSNEDEIRSTIEISVSSPVDTRTSEIARKFYASMRNNSQCYNSSSLDSDYNDTSMECNIPSLPTDKFKQEENMQLFRTPRFFQSIPNTGLKKSFLLFLEKYSFCFLDELSISL